MSPQAHRPRLVAPMLVVATVMVASCNDDELAPPQTGEAIEHIGAHLAMVTNFAMLQLIAPPDGGEVTPSVTPPPMVIPCSAGGTTGISTVMRDSPYTLLPITVSRREHEDCHHELGPADPEVPRLELDGVSELGRSGSLTGGGLVEYRREGNPDGTMPLMIRSTHPPELIEQRDVRLGRWDIRWTGTGAAMVTEATAVHSREVYFSYTNGNRFEGRYVVGTAAHPFRIRTQGDIARISGAYEFDAQLCSSGEMRVETQQELVSELATHGFSSGKLRLIAADGNTATATFLGGGRVRVEDASGVSEIENWSRAYDGWANDCFGQWVE